MEINTYQTLHGEYARAFASARWAKNILMAIVLLGLLAQLAFAAGVRYYGVVDQAGPIVALAPVTAERATTLPATGPGSAPAPAAKNFLNQQPDWWYFTIAGTMDVVRVAVPLAALLAVVALLMMVNLSLLARTGGLAAFVSAFFWTVVLLGLLAPWQNLPQSYICGALANFDELIEQTRRLTPSWGGVIGTWNDQAAYSARFFALPVGAVMVWLLIMLKSARGLRLMNESTSLAQNLASTRPAAPSAAPAAPITPILPPSRDPADSPRP